MTSASYERVTGDRERPALFSLAEKLRDTPGGFDRYNYAKSVWLGNPDREKRLAGEHPWPSRERHGEQYIYSVPVFAGVDVESEKLLYVSKDNWKAVDDPDAWLVAERGLLKGDEVEYRVLNVSVDTARQLRITLAPAGYDNFPPSMQYALRGRPAYAQTMLGGRLDDSYALATVQLREGLDSESKYEDIEALESAIVMVQQLRQAESEQLHDSIRLKSIEGALAERALLAAA